MAIKRNKLNLTLLESVSDELRLPSLSLVPPRLEGYAYRFKIILPLLSQAGEEVFSVYQQRLLIELFDHRFGGCLVSASMAHPSWFGSYMPAPGAEPVKDYHTIIYIYSKQIDAADRFFQILKVILKKAGFQDEVLIERVPAWLVEAADHS